ncbi:Myc-type, basic helix-loop-helix domain-containing protein [Pilobolus umbonatus]|nr:Myc-type, basic helix-loop-helix domain-containing protein [Pilobolus umbonatus]
MYNVQFHSSYNNTTQHETAVGLNEDVKPYTTAITSTNDRPAQTDAVRSSYDNMKYEQNYKLQSRKDLYCQPPPPPQQQSQEYDNWANSSTPSSDSFGGRHTSDPNVSPQEGLDDEFQQRHMQQLFDKKRKRRESHNAVERRRRDHINERIVELSTLLPERDASKNNKGTILSKSVDHIRALHEKVNQYQQRVQELEHMLEIYRMRWGDINTNSNTTTTTTTTNNTRIIPLDMTGMPHLSNGHPTSYSRDN